MSDAFDWAHDVTNYKWASQALDGNDWTDEKVAERLEMAGRELAAMLHAAAEGKKWEPGDIGGVVVAIFQAAVAEAHKRETVRLRRIASWGNE